jgi:hypothetical protein
MAFAAAKSSSAGATILSGEQHIWGRAEYSYLIGEPPDHTVVTLEDSYDSGVVPWDGSWLSDRAEVHPSVYGYSEIGGLYAYVESDAWSWDLENPTDAWGSATAKGTWTFRPDGDTLILATDFRLWNVWYDHLLIEVTDLTSAEQLYYLQDQLPMDSFEGQRLEEVLSDDPAHEYRLTSTCIRQLRYPVWPIEVLACPAPAARCSMLGDPGRLAPGAGRCRRRNR